MADELNLRQIDVFRALVKFGTVTSAAAALGSSQPTITREVLRIESQIGFRLFDRRRQRLHPTSRALKLYHEIERSFSGLDHINAALHRLREANGEILQVSTLPTFAQSILPAAVARLHREAPGLSIEIANGDPRNQSPVSGFNFDLGLIEGEYSDPTTQVIEVGRFNQVCLMPAHHPLASKRVLGLHDFEDQPFISLGSNDLYRVELDRLFNAAGVRRQLTVTTQSANAACEMVRHGLGLVVLNPLTAMCYLDASLVLRAFEPAQQFVVSALRPADRPLVDSAAKLILILRGICQEKRLILQEMGLA